MADPAKIISVDYEVFGTVQGVFFRKFTHEEATKLGLVGWVKNTTKGTVVGTLQGPEAKVKHMQNWLAKTGSPQSKIQKCEFHNEKSLAEISYANFDIVRPKKKKKTR